MSAPADLATLIVEALDDAALDALAERLGPRLAARAGEAAAPTGGDRWLGSREAAHYLGLPSVHALHKLTAARSIPFAQDAPGARCYFRLSEIDRWRGDETRQQCM